MAMTAAQRARAKRRADAAAKETRAPAATSPFSDWTIEDATNAVDIETNPPPTLSPVHAPTNNLVETNELFVAGDHWQDGAAWVGPAPQPEEAGFGEAMAEIAEAFVSRNVIGEVVERHTSFLIGKAPRWGLSPRRALKSDEEPSTEEQALIDEAEAALTAWWDMRNVHGVLQDLSRVVLWATRSTIRLYVPKGKLTIVTRGNRSVMIVAPAASLDEALAKIWPANPRWDQATVSEDDDTKEKCGVFIFANDGDNDSDDTTDTLAELSFLDGDETVIRIVGDDANGAQEFRLNLGKRLPMFEIARPLLITDQIQQAQRALNLAASMLPRNVVTGGFLERVLLNAQMPGKWEVNEKGEPTRFVPDTFPIGAGTTNFVSGLEITNPDGSRGLTTPDVRYREPASVDPSIGAKQEHYRDILEEAKQGHIITGADSKIGWKSRKQLRADSDKALGLTKTPVEACGRWLIETVLAMAEAFMGTPGKYTNVLRAEFICFASSGPLEVDEAADNRTAAKDGFLSRETAMERNDVDDVDAELARMNASPGSQVDIAAKQAVALQALTSAGADLVGAAEFLGIPIERAQLLIASDTASGGAP